MGATMFCLWKHLLPPPKMVQSLERETHDDIHIVARHIHNFVVVMGVILCLLSLGMYFSCVHLSLLETIYISLGIHTYISEKNPWSFWGGLHYSWENIKQTLYTQQRKRNNLYSKRIHKWIIIIIIGGGWVFP